uniref:Solute carrier family 25 member 40 n=1 Tax=Naja naja TaxID=35670 RepID=A0A8C6XDH4_NAJNA
MIAVFQYLKGCHREEGVKLFTKAPVGQTRNNGWKLNKERFNLEIRRNFLTVKTVSQWNSLPLEVVGASSFETFKKRLDCHLSGMDAFAKIVQREGVKALWSGLPPSLAVSVPTTVIYFTCYDQLRDAFINKLGDNDYIPLIAGGIARLFSATIISPIEMIRTRMQSRRLTYTELLARISTGVTQNGWLSLWKGWGPTILRDVPFSALYWYNYEYFKMSLCKKSSSHEPTFLIIFSSGAAAGSVSEISVCRKMRCVFFYSAPQKKTRSIWEVMKRIVIENGFTGLFTGIIPRLSKIAPACAIMISTYEYGKTFFPIFRYIQWYLSI